MDSVKADEETATPPRIPSFKGKLNLADYGFSPKSTTKEGSSTPLRSSPKRKSTSITPSPSPSPRKRSKTGYAPPTTYAHLPELRDVITPNLICVFIGLNPGLTTASTGHAYAHPSNLFWKLLHSSGCTTRRCRPEEDGDLPDLFELGNTNIVSRPTRNGGELSKAEMDASVHVLEEKIRRFKPEAVCIVGKSIWESLWRVKHGRVIRKEEFRYGWQSERENLGKEKGDGEEWNGAKVFVATTTSGLAATMSLAEKEAVWRQLGVWVEKRRAQRTGLKTEEVET